MHSTFSGRAGSYCHLNKSNLILVCFSVQYSTGIKTGTLSTQASVHNY